MDHDRPSKNRVREIVSEHVAEQYDRGHSVVDASAGLERLHGQLVDAARAYESGPLKQRHAVCDAIMATCEFLEGQGFGSTAIAPLRRVLWAIVDLCGQNRPDPLFCEKAKKNKARRGMEDAVRQGQLAALADAWLKSHASDEGGDAIKLARAARRMSGAHFGTINGTMLQTARTYQRQHGHHELVYESYEQMSAVLSAESAAVRSVGGGSDDLRVALEVQIDALNAKADLQKR